MRLLLVLLIACIAFFLRRMLLKGTTAAGVTRSGDPMAYWGIAVIHASGIAFLIYVLMRGDA